MSKQGHSAQPGRFLLYLIKTSRYDENGYVLQWMRSAIPSNSLASVYGIANDASLRRVLGDGVEIEIRSIDETNTPVHPEKIVREIEAAGGRGLVALVGVQSNQFPRAVDIARPILAAGIQVCIGGFHVSGCLAMLPETPPDIQAAMDLGISIFAGEAEEGRLDQVLVDADARALKPVYNFMADLPSLEGVPVPSRPTDDIKRYFSNRTSFDSGRGCPFQCSFCTIINVQGRKSRYRTADDIELLLRENYAKGVRKLFITDDNFARNKNWEAIFDRMIELHENDGMRFRFFIQVDTLCHRIPNFIEKAKKAGVNIVFIGLESINPENLLAANKRQNKISEFRQMFLAWKQVKIITVCGYILGLPNDTPQSIKADIAAIQQELPLDMIEFNILTPLPGSVDHQRLHAAGVEMDSDMNRYDLEHVVTDHPSMSRDELFQAYLDTWQDYFTDAHIETMMRRAQAVGMKPSRIYENVFAYFGMMKIEGVHPLQGGMVRRMVRRTRRHGLALENPLIFYGRYWSRLAVAAVRWYLFKRRLKAILVRVEADAKQPGYSYTDVALTIDPVEIPGATNTAPPEIAVSQDKEKAAAAA